MLSIFVLFSRPCPEFFCSLSNSFITNDAFKIIQKCQEEIKYFYQSIFPTWNFSLNIHFYNSIFLQYHFKCDRDFPCLPTHKQEGNKWMIKRMSGYRYAVSRVHISTTPSRAFIYLHIIYQIYNIQAQVYFLPDTEMMRFFSQTVFSELIYGLLILLYLFTIFLSRLITFEKYFFLLYQGTIFKVFEIFLKNCAFHSKYFFNFL